MSTDVKVGNVRVAEVRAHSTNVRRDLGDLRALIGSIRRFGVMQPIVVDRRGDHWRLRDGHRRLAAAQALGMTRIPAVIHSDDLEDDEWLTQAVHANTRRRDLDKADRAHAVEKMRASGMTWEGIAREFDVSVTAVQRWADDRRPTASDSAKRVRIQAATLARLIDAWQAEINAGNGTAQDALDAIAGAAQDGRCAEHYPGGAR